MTDQFPIFFSLIQFILLVFVIINIKTAQNSSNNKETALEVILLVIIFMLFLVAITKSYEYDKSRIWGAFLTISIFCITLYFGIISYLGYKRKSGNMISFDVIYNVDNKMEKLWLYNYKDKPSVIMGIFLREKISHKNFFFIKKKTYNYIPICNPSRFPLIINELRYNKIFIDNKIHKKEYEKKKLVFVLSTIDGKYIMRNKLNVWIPSNKY